MIEKRHCSKCEKKQLSRGLCKNHYEQLPERKQYNKKYIKKYMNEHYTNDKQFRKRALQIQKKYNNSEKGKITKRKYNSKPELKERRKKYMKKYMKEYRKKVKSKSQHEQSEQTLPKADALQPRAGG